MFSAKLRSEPAVGEVKMEIPKNIFQYDWAAMSATDQRAFFSKNGFLVIPQLFTPEEVDLMHKEIEQYGLAEKKIDMSEAFCSAPSFAPMVDHPKLVSALTSILGSNFICFKGAYVPKHSKQGVSAPHRTALHVDYGILERRGRLPELQRLMGQCRLLPE